MDVGQMMNRLLSGGPLSEDEAEAAFESLFAGQLDPAQTGAMLALMAARGPTIDELVGAGRVMRRHVTRIPAPPGLIVLDTCGTGGAPKTFNISTAAAIVVAAAGARVGESRVVVAKHGNRSRTGRGSAEVLQRLGVNVDASPEVQARCLERAGVCFCFAIHHHPAARHAAPVRKSLGFPTIFNLLGPLTNPAGADHQLIGVYHPAFVEPVARALARLGTRRAMVVHGQDGMDELSTTAPTWTATVNGASVHCEVFDSAQLGISRTDLASLAEADLESAAARIERVLDGGGGPARDIIALNAGAALMVAGAAASIGDGIAMALGAIDSGRARQTLALLARESAV